MHLASEHTLKQRSAVDQAGGAMTGGRAAPALGLMSCLAAWASGATTFKGAVRAQLRWLRQQGG